MLPSTFDHITTRIALFWAGVALAGNVLAATAKFQIESLPMPLALQLGHIQFVWTASAELSCIALMLICWLLALRRKAFQFKSLSTVLILIATAVFAIQHLLLMPPLHERTLKVIAGEVLEKSHLHKTYATTEVIKFLALVITGCLPVKSTAAKGEK